MSQFHKYFKPGVLDRLNTLFHGISGVSLGEKSIIMKGAILSRFPKKIKIGDKTIIKANADICVCNPDAKISIGSDTTVGNYSFIYASDSVSIGDFCLIAPFVYIVDSNHLMGAGMPIRLQENISKPIVIKDDVWIGAHSIILSGCEIGKGAVIAANSVVNCNVKEYEIWGGSPAKKIGERT